MRKPFVYFDAHMRAQAYLGKHPLHVIQYWVSPLTQGMQVIKDMRVDGLSIYWCPAKPHASADPDSPIAAWLGAMEQSTVLGLPPDMHDILPSLSFDLRLTTKYGK